MYRSFFLSFCNVHKVLKQINAQKLNKSYTTCIKSEGRSVSPCLPLKNIAKKYRRVCIS